jgi:predicted SnoaL-like aldol condensation-catalyzing enzyme
MGMPEGFKKNRNRPNPSAGPERLQHTSDGQRSSQMNRTLVRYKIKPEHVQDNARLIKRVFEELKVKSPDNARYVVLQLDDGSFVHFAAVESVDGNHPITSLEAFRVFQSGIKERCIESPQSGDATIVGNYRMVDE